MIARIDSMRFSEKEDRSGKYAR